MNKIKTPFSIKFNLENASKLITVLLMFIYSTCLLPAQVLGDGPIWPCGEVPNPPNGGRVDLSRDGYPLFSSGTDNAFITTDGVSIDGHSASTDFEFNPYWEIDLGCKSYIENIRFFHSLFIGNDLINFYIFVSNQPFGNSTLFNNLNNGSNYISHINIPITSGDSIPIEHIGRYVRIQKNGLGILTLDEIFINGYKEICNDGIDNDCDGVIDCSDNDCKPKIINIEKINPSCPICNNGKICVQADNTHRISIDGGISWYIYQPGVIKCFEGLGVNNYNIVIEGFGTQPTCSQNASVILTAPTDGNEGPCANGGFEQGNFTNWTGMTGKRTVFPGNIIWNPSNGINSNSHEIINVSQNWQDPYVNFINSNGISLGNYIVKLGNTGIRRGAEKITYCFTVDESNKDFCFNYAIVLHNPNIGHPNNQLPYFDFKIYKKGNSNGPYIDQYNYVSNDPALQPGGVIDLPTDPDTCINVGNEVLMAKGWTCSCTDLTEFIGQEICIDFITADCAQGCHFAYAYIDGLCSPPNGTNPIGELTCIPNKLCKNQTISMEFKGTLFNKYQWTISKIDENNIEYGKLYSGIIDGYVPKIEDLKAYYQQLGGSPFTCPLKIKIEINLYGECAHKSYSCIIDYICEEYDINYCDLLVCSNPPTVQIQGVNNCTNCITSWTPSIYFDNSSVKFPFIEGYRKIDAYDKIYEVKVITPSGCEYKDEIKVVSKEATIDVHHNIFKDFTTIKVEVEITSNFSMPNDIATIYVTNKFTGLIYNLVFDAYKSTEFKKFYSYTFRRDIRLYLEVTGQFHYDKLSGFDGFCVVGNCIGDGTIYKKYDEIFEDNFNFGWFFIHPNIFSPNGDGINDEYFVNFYREKLKLNCSPAWDFLNSGAYSFKMSIYDRQGARVYDNKFSVDPCDLFGVGGNELKWDGTFNGQPVVVGVYTVNIETWTIYSINDCNKVCINPCNWFNPPCTSQILQSVHCPSSDHDIFAFDIQLIQ